MAEAAGLGVMQPATGCGPHEVVEMGRERRDREDLQHLPRLLRLHAVELPVAPAERHLVEVSLQVLPAQIMVDAEHRSTQLVGVALGAVYMDVVEDELLHAVAHRVVFLEVLPDFGQGLVAIGHQHGIALNVIEEDRAQAVGLLVLQHLHPRLPVTFRHDQHGLLRRAFPRRIVDVLDALRGAADVRRVGLDDPFEACVDLRPAEEHLADRMAHLPGRLLGHAEMPGQHDRRDPLARAENEVDRKQPGAQRKLGAMQRRVRGDGELAPALPALPKPGPIRLLGAAAEPPGPQPAAMRTYDAVRPDGPLECLSARLFGFEPGRELPEGVVPRPLVDFLGLWLFALLRHLATSRPWNS